MEADHLKYYVLNLRTSICSTLHFVSHFQFNVLQLAKLFNCNIYSKNVGFIFKYLFNTTLQICLAMEWLNSFFWLCYHPGLKPTKKIKPIWVTLFHFWPIILLLKPLPCQYVAGMELNRGRNPTHSFSL